MRHARPHIQKFWRFQNRRTIGLILALVGMVYAIGLVFTVILNQYFVINFYNIVTMWAILFFIAVLTVVGSVAESHKKIAKLLNYQEHMKHSKNIGLFIVVLVFGTVAFTLPVILFPQQASLWILFSVGGVLMLLYVLLGVIFGYGYHEVGFASAFIWMAFLIGVFSLSQIYYQNKPLFDSLAFLITSITIITVFSITGIFMLHRASNEFIEEFRTVNKIKN